MNLAAESHVDRSIDGPREFIQTNIVGTFTAFAGSAAVLSFAGAEPPRHIPYAADLAFRVNAEAPTIMAQ